MVESRWNKGTHTHKKKKMACSTFTEPRLFDVWVVKIPYDFTDLQPLSSMAQLFFTETDRTRRISKAVALKRGRRPSSLSRQRVGGRLGTMSGGLERSRSSVGHQWRCMKNTHEWLECLDYIGNRMQQHVFSSI